jgi:RHS repeat-associated protein
VLLQAGYSYDAFGNQISLSVTQSGTTTVTHYSYQDPQSDVPTLWAELSGSNSLQMRYLRGDDPNQLLGRVDAGGNAGWYLTDHLGSVRGVTNAAGALQTSITYDAFGNTLSTGFGTFGYAGYALHAELGMYATKARLYDPAAGRWYSQDPMAFDAGDSNLYRYSGNGPTGATDPSGLQQNNDAPDPRGQIDAYAHAWGVAGEMNEALRKQLTAVSFGLSSGKVDPHLRQGPSALGNDFSYCWSKGSEWVAYRDSRDRLDRDIDGAFQLATKAYSDPSNANLRAIQDANDKIARRLFLIDAYTRLFNAAVFLYNNWGDLPRGSYPNLIRDLSEPAKKIEALLGKSGDDLSDQDTFTAVDQANQAITRLDDTIQAANEGAKFLANYNKVVTVVSLAFGVFGAVRVAAGRLAAGEIALFSMPRLVPGLALSVETQALVVNVNQLGNVTAGVLLMAVVRGGLGPNRVGSAGSSKVPGDQNYEYVKMKGKWRQPDRWGPGIIEEVKNVAYQHLSRQLEAYIEYARKTGRQFTLWVRGDAAAGGQTGLSPQLVKAITRIRGKIKAIPGTGKFVMP